MGCALWGSLWGLSVVCIHEEIGFVVVLATLSWLLVTDGSLACRQVGLVAWGFLLGLIRLRMAGDGMGVVEPGRYSFSRQLCGAMLSKDGRWPTNVPAIG